MTPPRRRRPPPGPPPNPPPFTVLAKPRFVAPGLPSDLAAFYARHEGVGRGASCEKNQVRLHTLAELTPAVGAEFWVEGDESEFPGWQEFRAIRVAYGNFGEAFLYVTGGGDFRFGSILAVGKNVVPDVVRVMALNHADWLARLRRDNWLELGISGLGDQPPMKVALLRRYFRLLNPRQEW